MKGHTCEELIMNWEAWLWVEGKKKGKLATSRNLIE